MTANARRPVSRRALLGASALSSLGFLMQARAGRADAPVAVEPVPGAPVLVCVFLRGAADGLNIVVPHADPDYYRLRPSIAVPRPGEQNGALDLDGHFGLHPKLAPLKAVYDAGQLLPIQAVGSPHPTRSHFEAQDYMSSGVVGDRTIAQGWLAGYLKSRPAQGSDLLRAVALTERPPLSLRGYADAIVTPSLGDFRLGSGVSLSPVLAQGFRRLYRTDATSHAERAGQRALESSQLVERVLRRQKSSLKYSRDTADFADLGRLIKADVGLQVAWLDVSGWDTHRQEGSVAGGELPRQLERLGRALATFRADLGPHFERVVVLVMSEFGRTAKENGTGGTDHGHGGAMLVMGGKLQGSRVLGSFPGLAPEKLNEGRDLSVTTDFRDVLAEVCERHLGVTDPGPLFPGYALDKQRRLGLFA